MPSGFKISTLTRGGSAPTQREILAQLLDPLPLQSVCIKGGHSVGRNRNVYIVHGETLDNYCCLVLAGLPVCHENFPVSYTRVFSYLCVSALTKFVTISMPWEDKCRYFKQPTGIPPHAILPGYIRGLKTSFEAMPARIEAMMDKCDYRGGLLIDKVIRAVREPPQLSAMSNDIISIK